MKLHYAALVSVLLNSNVVLAEGLPCCQVNGELRCGTKLDCDPQPTECPPGEILSCHGGLAPDCECREPTPARHPGH